MVSYKYFRSLRFVSSKFWAGLGAVHTVFHENSENMFYNCLVNDFCCALKSNLARRSARTYIECSNLSIFSRKGYFPSGLY